VTVGGILQLALAAGACKRAGIVLKIRKPRLTRRAPVHRVVIPATLGAGVYQISVSSTLSS
jgi:putative peptidoglycan lipid II flippase